MGVILLGEPLILPEAIDASYILAMRSPKGEAPCKGGVDRAIAWIGGREIPLGQALEEAGEVGLEVDWAAMSLGIFGYGIGDGYGAGSGSGHGHGDGYGYGYVYGHGSGYGDGYGSGYGDGYGSGDGHGYGTGYGFGYGDGYGYSDY